DPSKYAVNQKAPVPNRKPPDHAKRHNPPPAYPFQIYNVKQQARIKTAQGDLPSNLPASPLKKKQKSGQALY
ncbi:hypothetical protein AAFN88_21850, partial [Pelagibius sp. CAU 1746]|uniref:hypothetical protein n=1 Tax=Pelagibius sp. CAU 1746 TaxID=3140370 RepID=UPI00325B56D7